MSDASTNAEIVRTIIVLAHNLGLEVIAEGRGDGDGRRAFEVIGM